MGLGSGEEIFFQAPPPPGRADQLNILALNWNKLERLPLSGKVTWDWSVRDNMCS